MVNRKNPVRKTAGAARAKTSAKKTASKKSPARRTTPGATKKSVAHNRSSSTKKITSRRSPSKSSGGKKRNSRGGRNDHRRRDNNISMTPKKEDKIPPLRAGTIRVIPLGGVEEVGRNMTLIEYGNDIIVSDMGFEFTSDEDVPGVDYLIPNTKYLEDRLDKVKAVVITHGHLDHIGGIPFMIEKLGNPPMYTRYLTSIMIKKRQAEYPHLPDLDLRVIEPGKDEVELDSCKMRFFPVTHSIPDSMGLIIETPDGNIVVSGDLKLDHDEGTPTKEEERIWGNIGKEDNILLIADSTNAEQTGFSISERIIQENIERIIKEAPGRLIMGLFASQFERMIKIIGYCEKYGKKVVTEGRSIKNNIEIGQKAKIMKPKPGTIIPVQEIDKHPSNKIVVLATGAQGEEFAALNRIATKKHKFITMTERDTILLSSSVIPGNEISVQRLKDNLYRHTSNIIHYKTHEVHTSGHGNQEELAWFASQVKPRFHMPAYGFHSMTKSHAKVIRERGIVPRDNIIVADNGSIVEFYDKGKKMRVLQEKAPSAPRMVDGFSVGDMQEVLIRDRQLLAQDGIFVIIATVNLKTGKLRKSPDIISRGFVYLRESQELLQQTRLIIKRTIESSSKGMNPINFDYIKSGVSDDVGRFLFQKTNKRPIVIPVILGV
jgi:ribonuclease J